MLRRKNPGTVTAAAVLLFVYGGMLTTCNLVGSAASAVNNPDDPMKLQETMVAEVPGYRLVSLGTMIVGFLIGAGMIFAGVGVLKLKPASRKTAIFLCFAQIVTVLASNVYSAILVFPVTSRLLADQANQAQMPPGLAQFMPAMMWAGLVFNLLFAAVFCGVIIGLLNAVKARAAFAGQFDEDPLDRLRDRDDDFDDDPPPPSASDTGIRRK